MKKKTDYRISHVDLLNKLLEVQHMIETISDAELALALEHGAVALAKFNEQDLFWRQFQNWKGEKVRIKPYQPLNECKPANKN